MSHRVLWLTKGLGRGGAEQLIATCAPLLNGDQFCVEVAYLLPWKDAFVDRLLFHGVKVHCLNAGRDVERGWPLRLHQLMRSGDFTLLHTHSPMPAAVARSVAPRHVKIVHTEHAMWTRYKRPTRWVNAVTYRRNDAVIAVSEAVAATISQKFVSGRLPGIDVVLHGVDLAASASGPRARAAARNALGLRPSEVVIGAVGNLTPAKDHMMLLEAFALVHQRRPETRLFVIGSGPLEARLRRRVGDLSLGRVVTLLGSRDDVRKLLPAFDIFALSSRFEGLSIALVEALAAGLPVVTTRVGGTPEVLGTGVGLMVPPRDPASFAEALVGLIADEPRRKHMAAGAQRRATAFDIRRSTRHISLIYDRIITS